MRCFVHVPLGGGLRGRPRTHWRDCLLARLAEERFGVPSEELEEIAGERVALDLCLDC